MGALFKDDNDTKLTLKSSFYNSKENLLNSNIIFAPIFSSFFLYNLITRITAFNFVSLQQLRKQKQKGGHVFLILI